MKRLVFSLIYATVVLLCTAVPAQGVPRLINYQGILTDDTGNPLDGSYQLTFRIYETTQAATPLWSEAHATQVSNGLFNVILGGVTAFPAGLFDADERWLSIQIDSEPEMYPWIRLTSVAWALRAAVADSVSGGGGTAGDNDWTISGSDMYASVSGNVGVGTSTPAAKLDVVGDGRVVRALASGNRPAVEAKHSASENLAYLADSTAGVRGISTFGAGVFAQSDSVALVAENTSTIRTNAYLAGEKAVYGESATGNVGYLGGGVFGVYGEEVINGNYGGVGYWQYGVLGHSDAKTGVRGRSTTGTGVWGSSTSGRAGYFSGDVVVEDGDLTTPVLEITGGSDLSEGFDIRDPEGGTPAPGMVVCVDPARPGQLMVSRAAYDTRVAGVISGAGGVRPGLLMGQEGSTASGGSPVALTGRVYCLADASGGVIVPGDLLTTSNTAGHAMKAEDRDRSHGAIIGKAMTPLENGRGLVLVLVSLQ